MVLSPSLSSLGWIFNRLNIKKVVLCGCICRLRWQRKLKMRLAKQLGPEEMVMLSTFGLKLTGRPEMRVADLQCNPLEISGLTVILATTGNAGIWIWLITFYTGFTNKTKISKSKNLQFRGSEKDKRKFRRKEPLVPVTFIQKNQRSGGFHEWTGKELIYS